MLSGVRKAHKGDKVGQRWSYRRSVVSFVRGLGSRDVRVNLADDTDHLCLHLDVDNLHLRLWWLVNIGYRVSVEP